ncbi:MAG TPA: hypothetical protein VFB38_24725 [Chthonomonadaceae bacterium]|nr:hypothetical protein [Chthonomonadaceae bacterium]
MALAGLLVLLLLGGLWQQQSLASRASRVGTVASWNVVSGDYYWLSNQKVLFCRKDSRGREPLFCFVPATGQEKPLPALSRLLQASAGDPATIKVSPDGQWLIWASAHRNRICGARLDGSRSFRGFLSAPSSFHWLGRSGRWVECLWGDQGAACCHALVHSVSSPHRLRRVPVTPRLSAPFLITLTSHQHLLTASVPEGRLNGSRFRVSIQQAGLGNNRAPHRRFTIALPPGRKLCELEFSPNGDRVVWLLEESYVPPVSAWLHRVCPEYSASSGPALGIWISRLDGTQMREVGCVPVTRSWQEHNRVPIQQWARLWPVHIHWLPDGKQLSFVYRDALWMVPAD